MNVPNKVVELPFLKPDECAMWTQKVFDNGRYLIPQGVYYTLGQPAYLVPHSKRDQYPATSNMYNLMLNTVFGRLHSGLASAVGSYFKRPVGFFTDGVMLPSFHLFDNEVEGFSGGIHIDEEHENIIAMDNIEWSDHFSITVPVCLPDSEMGLDVWYDFDIEEVEELEFIPADLLPEPEMVPYKLGKLYIHSGAFPHRVHKPDTILPGEHRITLQGHGVNTADGIILYW